MSRRLIEKNLPIKEISEISIPERSSYKPIYQISKWFARRSSSTFRALLLASSLDSKQDLMKKFYTESEIPEKVVLDPFMGGGTTIVEGLRLGMRCIGIDINPIAWFITKTEIEAIPEETLDAQITHCEENLALSIQKWYKTKCPVCNRDAEIIYVHWVKLLPCEVCNFMVTLFRNYILTKKGNFHTILCPSCFSVFTTNLDSKFVNCPKCDHYYNPKIGNRISRSSYKCTKCGNISNILNSIRNYSKILPSQMYAIEGYCSHCAKEKNLKSPLKSNNFKFIKRIERGDEELYRASIEQWESLKSTLIWPKAQIPDGTTTKTLKNHNYSFWSDLFNPRQLLCLSIILDYIKSVNNLLTQEMLLAAFLNLLNHNNIFTRYSPAGQKVEGVFARHDFHPLSTYAENNVWGTKYGRGTWIKCLKRLMEGKKYNFKPYSHIRRVRKNTVKVEKVYSGIIHGKILFNPIEDFTTSSSYNSLLLCRDAEESRDILPMVDLIITDPPYADNVNYSELSDFFYVWLRLVLNNRYPFFANNETPKEAEAIDDKNRAIDYYEKLIRIFRSIKTKLKPEGLIVFTFHHSNPSVWCKLTESLFSANLKVIKTYALPSEARNVLNIRNKVAIAFDLIIVLKLKEKSISQRLNYMELKSKLKKECKLRFKSLKEAEIEIKGNDHLAVIFGVLMELLSEYIVEDDLLKQPSVSEIWGIISDLITKDLMEDQEELQ